MIPPHSRYDQLAEGCDFITLPLCYLRDSLEDEVVDEGADSLTGLLCVGCSSSVSRVSPFSVPASLCSVTPLSDPLEEQLLDSTLPG